MRELQLFILDLQGNQLGELDLTDSDDFALKLTKSIASINDLGRRNTSFSLDFEAPQTKNNNKLLTGLRFISATKEILGKKPCAIMVDGNQVDRGYLYPFESEVDGKYKLVFKGLNNDWVEKLQDVELNQLNWRDYLTGLRTQDATELFKGSRFTTLNGQNSVTSDLIYPYVNRNNGGATSAFRPQLHLRSIILSMFEKIGYTVSSAFLETNWVKGLNPPQTDYLDAHGNQYEHLGLSVDPNFQMTREQQALLNQTVEYSTTNVAVLLPPVWNTTTVIGNLATPAAPNVRSVYRFPTSINNTVLDNFSRFNTVTSEFTVGLKGLYDISLEFAYEWAWNIYGNWVNYTQVISPNIERPPSIKWYIVKNNTNDTVVDGAVLHTTTNIVASGVGIPTPVQLLLTTGDKISLFLELFDDSHGFTGALAVANANQDGIKRWKLRINNGSVLKIVPKQQVTLGDTFRINSHIPDGIKCMTLLQDFKTMFNLYFDVDVNRKEVIIEPRDAFYQGTAINITDRIDFNTAPKLNYLSNYRNQIVFDYVTDSKDKYLEQWNKFNNKTYGQYKYTFGNNERFDKGQSVLSTSLISATIQEDLEGATTGIMSSIIKEEYLDADNLGKPVNSNYGMRVFQLIKGRQYTPANVPRRTTSPLTVLVAAMEDYANTPTFGDNRLTFDATNGLVERYYAKTLANIEDTAILTLKIILTLQDYFSWDLKKVYYISEPAEIAGYYITDSIKNFNVTKEAPTTITLVKYKDYTPVAITQGIGNVNVITQTNPQPQEIFVTVNGAIVSCLDNNLNKMYKI